MKFTSLVSNASRTVAERHAANQARKAKCNATRAAYVPLTKAELSKVLKYDPDTGVFTWAMNHGRIKQGTHPNIYYSSKGYKYIRLNGILTPASKLAHVLMIGCEPAGEMRYIDRDNSNLKWGNLQEALFKT